jgi:hypothetical protein
MGEIPIGTPTGKPTAEVGSNKPTSVANVAVRPVFSLPLITPAPPADA